jgi:hypothetical protein
MKAQVEAITLVLISGIVIALVGGAYLWGKPLIEKRTDATDIANAINFAENLNKKIIDIAKTCTTPGACESSLDLPSKGVVTINESDNSIIYEFNINQPLITDEIPINTGNIDEIANFGETPSIIWMKGSVSGDAYKITIKIKYRELLDESQKKGYIIKLTGRGSGRNKIMVSYDGYEVGRDFLGNDLIITKITTSIV